MVTIRIEILAMRANEMPKLIDKKLWILKKILEYKIIRFILAISVSSLMFPLARILESIEPALSNWMLIVFVMVLIYSLTWAQDYPDTTSLKLDSILHKTKSLALQVVGYYLYFILLYITYRIVLLGYEWLKFGDVSAYTTCNVVGLFCNNYYDWIGLNKILDWLGYNDILFTIFITSAIGLAILVKVLNNE